MPKRRLEFARCIERIHTIVFGCYENNVMSPFSGDTKMRYIKWLDVYRPIDLQSADLPKAVRVYVLWGQDGFGEICSGSSIIVLRGCDLRAGGKRHSEGEKQGRPAGSQKRIGARGVLVLLIRIEAPRLD